VTSLARPAAPPPRPPLRARLLGQLRIPDTWLAALGWTVVAFSLGQVLCFGFGRDQAIYAEVARRMAEGAVPYRDVWDFKPPGIFSIYAAAFAVFGERSWAPRVLEVSALLLLVLAFRGISRIATGRSLPGTVGGALACLAHAQLDFWHTGQPESFGAATVAVALWAALRYHTSPSRRRAAWATGSGVLFGLSFLLKPPLGGGALVCAIALGAASWRQQRRLSSALAPALLLGGGALLVLGTCAGIFAWSGAWEDLTWTLFEFAPGYTRAGAAGSFASGTMRALHETFWQYGVWGLSGVVLGVLAATEVRGLRMPFALVLSVALVHLIGVALQRKHFPYHHGAVLPLVALCAGFGFEWLWQRSKGGRLGRAGPPLAVAAMAALVAVRTIRLDVEGSFWWRAGGRLGGLFGVAPARSLDRVVGYDLSAIREVAGAVARRISTEDALYVWGFEPALYFFSGRRPASRFIYNVPQRATWQRARARAALLADLARDPPALFAVQHGDRFEWVTGDRLDSAESLSSFPELVALLHRDFHLSARVRNFDLYARRPRRSP
jgi:4-amino-4-deoxy-L-arabinose transferase-like glycosyltransferase